MQIESSKVHALVQGFLVRWGQRKAKKEFERIIGEIEGAGSRVEWKGSGFVVVGSRNEEE